VVFQLEGDHSAKTSPCGVIRSMRQSVVRTAGLVAWAPLFQASTILKPTGSTQLPVNEGLQLSKSSELRTTVWLLRRS